MSQWETDLYARISDEIRRLRTEQGMSAQALADRTEQAGVPVSRSTITDIELKRRKYITVAELIALAAALGTVPTALVYPGPYTEQVAVLPRVSAPQLRAVQWWTGERVSSPHLAALHQARERDTLADQQKAMLGLIEKLTDPGQRAAAIAVVAELARRAENIEPPAPADNVIQWEDVVARKSG